VKYKRLYTYVSIFEQPAKCVHSIGASVFGAGMTSKEQEVHMQRLTLAIAMWLCAAPLAGATTFMAHVVSVTDGDTIKVLTPERHIEILRLQGIDCPEKSQAFGMRAKQFTAGLVFNKDVLVEPLGHDRYGRIIADVRLKDGTSVEYALVKNGYAWWYRKYSNDPRLANFEEQARKGHFGLWSDPHAEAPWDFRKGMREQAFSARGQ
jgi:endonuclease YncB( thermonuclease family)